jgi:hypothetical protein
MLKKSKTTLNSGNRQKLLWQAFRTPEIAKNLCGKLSELRKPPKTSAASFPNSGNRQKPLRQAFRTPETAKNLCDKFSEP